MVGAQGMCSEEFLHKLMKYRTWCAVGPWGMCRAVGWVATTVPARRFQGAAGLRTNHWAR